MIKNQIVSLLIILTFLLAGCEGKGLVTYKKRAEVMSTYVDITVVSRSSSEADKALDAAIDEIRRLEKMLSFWSGESDISAVNRAAGIEPVRVSPETLSLARIALNVAKSTEGAFDPTIGPLVSLWDFRSAKVPSASEVKKVLPLVDYRKVRVDEEASSIFITKPGMSFDTGGIAKGYAVDRAIDVLREHGIESALVAIAGDIRAYGTRADGKPWRVGIRHPRSDDPSAIMAWLELNDEAISTSGDYERYFISDGKRYHHITDPSTGYPARGVISATVVAPRAVLTDGFSTGIFVLGPDKGLSASRITGFDALLLDEDLVVYATGGMLDRLVWVTDTGEVDN